MGRAQALPAEQAQGTDLECITCAWDRSNLSTLLKENTQGLQGSNHCWLHPETAAARGQ